MASICVTYKGFFSPLIHLISCQSQINNVTMEVVKKPSPPGILTPTSARTLLVSLDPQPIIGKRYTITECYTYKQLTLHDASPGL